MAGAGDSRAYAIIGAAIEVHRELGKGFLETVYREALAVEMSARRIEFLKEVELPVSYKGTRIPCSYRVDFLCFGEVVVELKALRMLSGADEAQIINYLKASRQCTGLLFNFGAPRLEHKRFAHTPTPSDLRLSAEP